MTYGERLRFVRNFRGMTQAELGAACGFGNNGHIFIAQYENGSRVPKKERNECIAKALNVAPQILMWDTDSTMQNIYYQMCWACMVPCDDFTFYAMDYMIGMLDIFDEMNQAFCSGEMSAKEAIEMKLQTGMNREN